MSAVCGKSVAFGDDYGDNETTFHCRLPKGHKGDHEESDTLYDGVEYRVSWKAKPKATKGQS